MIVRFDQRLSRGEFRPVFLNTDHIVSIEYVIFLDDDGHFTQIMFDESVQMFKDLRSHLSPPSIVVKGDIDAIMKKINASYFRDADRGTSADSGVRNQDQR